MQTLALQLNSESKLYQLFQILSCSLLLALSAQIAIPLPFSPVPITLQTFAVMLIGIKLGPKNAALAVLAYLAEIAMGCPFLPCAVSNPAVLVGFKAGYYFGYVAEAYLIGYLATRLQASQFFIFGVVACMLDLFLGTFWLSLYTGWKSAYIMGFIPFIPGEIVKLYVATRICQK